MGKAFIRTKLELELEFIEHKISILNSELQKENNRESEGRPKRIPDIQVGLMTGQLRIMRAYKDVLGERLFWLNKDEKSL